LKPTSYRLALEAYVEMWPPIPSKCLFARDTITAAFHRIRRRILRSMSSSPGKYGSSSGGMVLM
jgi:hypothetical protein